MNAINQAFGWVLRTFNGWTHHYLLALLLFALSIKLLLLPFGIQQQKKSIKGAKLRPKLALIEKKYAGRTDRATMEKKQQEIMELQRAEGYSPLSGCLPMIIQMVLIFILYAIIQNPLTYICQYSAEQIAAIREAVNATAGLSLAENVSQIELLGEVQKLLANGTFAVEGVNFALLPNFSLGSLNFALKPDFSSAMAVLPFLVFAVQFGTMKLTRLFMPANPMQPDQTREQKISMWIMDLSMPLLSLFFCFNLPSALGVYWIYQGLLGVLQQFILAKVMPLPKYTDEEIKEYLKSVKAKNTAPKTRVRSLHHIDDDDYESLPEPKNAAAKESKGPIAQAPIKQDAPSAPKDNAPQDSAPQDNHPEDGE